MWRWSLLPGITALQQTDEPYSCGNAQITDMAQRLPFVGGATDGWSGVAAQDFRRVDAGSTLVARKAWFFCDAGVVALGTGIASDGKFNVATAVEQRPLDLSPGGGAWVGVTSSPGIPPDAPQALPAGELLEGTNVSWVWHAGVLYALSIPGSQGMNASSAVPAVSTRNQTGSCQWADITQGPNASITIPTFLAYFHHGSALGLGGSAGSPAGYAYAILPGSASPQAAVGAYTTFLSSTAVLQNSPALQAVCFSAPNASTAWTLQTVAWPDAGVAAHRHAGSNDARPLNQVVRTSGVSVAACPAMELLSGPGIVQASLTTGGTLTVTFADPTSASSPRNASVALEGLQASGPACSHNGSHTVVSAPLPVQPGYAGSSVSVQCHV